MQFQSYATLTDYPYWTLIGEMIRRYGDEFVPSLNSRHSTRDQSFKKGTGGSDSHEYFDSLKSQPILIIESDKRPIAFMSYIESYHLPNPADTEVLYISTLIVDADYRKRGLARKLYQKLFTLYPEKELATRTWSTNDGHLHLLNSLAFQLALTIPNDRGAGIDTVYYVKKRGIYNAQ